MFLDKLNIALLFNYVFENLDSVGILNEMIA